MSSHSRHKGPYPSAHEDAQAARLHITSPQTESPSFKLAFQDPDLLLRDELRPVRLQLELLKPELVQQEHHIEATVVVFGSARTPVPEAARERLETLEARAARHPTDPALAREIEAARREVRRSRYYGEARELARLISQNGPSCEGLHLVVTTGGGPGIMEAANRGAHDAGAQSVGLNIVLPHEQAPNAYITPELSFQFHYFAIRKMHFLMRAKAIVVFPGGYGTLDEFFTALTLIQTGKIEPIPILLFGREFWRNAVNFDFLVEEGVISPEDVNYFKYVESAAEACEMIRAANHPDE